MCEERMLINKAFLFMKFAREKKKVYETIWWTYLNKSRIDLSYLSEQKLTETKILFLSTLSFRNWKGFTNSKIEKVTSSVLN